MAFDIANSIDWLVANTRSARWDVVADAMKVLEADNRRKMESDAWKNLLGNDFYLGLWSKKQLVEDIRHQWR